MLKQAFRSYWKTIFSKNLKDALSMFWSIYFFLAMPFFTRSIDNPQEAISLVFKMIPFILLGWRVTEPQIFLPKAMFLCPMKDTDRREYVQNLLRVKIGAPVIVSVVLQLIYGLLFQFNFMYVLFTAFGYFSIGISVFLRSYLENKHGRIVNGFVDKNGDVREAVANVLNHICAIFFLISWEMFDLAFESEVFRMGYMIVGFVLMSIFDIVIIKRRYEFVVREACDYELSFKVKKVWEEKYVKTGI